jgi:hypothetical protein
MAILDSGTRSTYETGAVRDVQEGKGRPCLMPLEVVAVLLDNDPVLSPLASFIKQRDTKHLYVALYNFAEMAYQKQIETMLLDVSIHYEEGAKKYGPNNWRKGLPVSCYMDSAIRHYLKYRRGDKDEAHQRAFVWNVMCCAWEVDYHRENKNS